MTPITVTVQEAAQMTGVSPDVIRAAINTLRLPAKRIPSVKKGGAGKRIVIKVSDLEAWVDSLEDVAS